MSYRDLIGPAHQTEQEDPRQMKNSAGGYVFELDKWNRFRRFLILGSDTSTFYASARDLTRENLDVVRACWGENPLQAAAQTVAVSIAGRAASNNAAILSVAIGVRHLDRAAGGGLVRDVCRTGTHILTLCSYLDALPGGWGRRVRRAVASWYEGRETEKLAYQVAKYRNRERWTHRGAMLMSHARGVDAGLADWVCGRPSENAPELCQLVDHLAQETDVATVVRAIQGNRSLSWEMLPSAMLGEAAVWDALLGRGMPLGALIRNLGRISSLGLTKPLGSGAQTIVDALANEDNLRKARIHPIAVLKALKTYALGRGIRGSLTWDVNQRIVSALDAAFYASFGNVEPMGKRVLLGIDVSGSMASFAPCAGGVLSAAEAAAAMAMVTLRTEPNAYVVGFSNHIKDLGITPTDTLQEVLRKTSMHNFGSTDCAALMAWAQTEGIDVDVFGTYTDNETWAGAVHPHVALQNYRGARVDGAKSYFVACTSTGFSLANPDDPSMLDCVGFDTATPGVVSEWAR